MTGMEEASVDVCIAQNTEFEDSLIPLETCDFQIKTEVEPPESDKAHYGMVNYLPPRPITETDDSIKLHIRTMKQEWKKRDRDLKKVNKLMDLTLSERRHFVVQEAPEVSEVLAEYPVLTDSKQVNR